MSKIYLPLIHYDLLAPYVCYSSGKLQIQYHIEFVPTHDQIVIVCEPKEMVLLKQICFNLGIPTDTPPTVPEDESWEAYLKRKRNLA